MLKANRSIVAPVGLGFLLLSLAAVPVSLEAAGSSLCVGSRFESVTRAWGKIATVFLSAYQPSDAVQRLALDYADYERPADVGECSEVSGKLACLSGDAYEETDTDYAQPSASDVSLVVSPKVQTEPRECSTESRAVSTGGRRARPLTTKLHLPRIEIDVVKLSLRSEEVRKLLDGRLAGYGPRPRFELSKLVDEAALLRAPRRAIKRPTSESCEGGRDRDRPEAESKERSPKARTFGKFVFTLQS